MKILSGEDAGTQKVRGLFALPSLPAFKPHPFLAYRLPLTEDDWWEIQYLLRFRGPQFVRPAPTEARHGFVDSRTARTVDEVQTIVTETLKADENAELIFMDPIDASYSGIFTPGLVTIGKGHDGATQGRDLLLTLPLHGVSIPSEALKKAHVTDTPYVECVWDRNKNGRLVQLRNGPAPATSGDLPLWCPKKTKVTGFILAGGDALEYEQAVKEAPEGTVILHENGSMISHFSAHAMLNRIPVWFSGPKPKLGDVLEPTVTKSPSYPQSVWEGIAASTAYTASFKMTENTDEDDLHYYFKQVAEIAISATHQGVMWQATRDGAFLIGFAAGMLTQLCYAACLGELRHRNRSRCISRHTVYLSVLKDFDHFRESRRRLYEGTICFFRKKWGADYGGPSWGRCAIATRRLDNAVIRMLRKPDKDQLTELLHAMHAVVNSAHNNGPFLSKFTEASNFERAANGDVSFYLHTLSQIVELLPGWRQIEYNLGQVKAWRRAHVKEPPLTPQGKSKPKPESKKDPVTECIKFQCTLEKAKTSKDDDAPYTLKHYEGENPSLVKGQTLQFNYRGEGNELMHFQFGKKGSYTSSTIMVSLLPDHFKSIVYSLDTEPFTSPSFYEGSSKAYQIIPLSVLTTEDKMFLYKQGIFSGGCIYE